MKRFHVHLHVDDLSRSVAFYSRLFATGPSRVEADYAKWMLDDPRVNFAISTRGQQPGIDHLGFQVDRAAELGELRERATSAAQTLLDEGTTTCCYARSEKHWITDPQGIAWEHFHTLEDIPLFNETEPAAGACGGSEPLEKSSACCAPAPIAADRAATGCCTASAAPSPCC